jgi:hypothetical protein
MLRSAICDRRTPRHGFFLITVLSGSAGLAWSNTTRRGLGDAVLLPVRRRSCRCLCRSRGGLGERREELAPVSGFVEDFAHFVATLAIAIEAPMLELEARVVPLRDKARLDFRLQIRVSTDVKLYLDSVVGTDDAFSGAVSTNSASLLIGRGKSGANPIFGFTSPGGMDDVRIYNRALSATEVQQLYNMGR